jgi:hypothetical protein
VVAIVLAAAVLHVTWNTLVKISADGYLATVLIATAGAVLCGVALPFLPAMAPAAWINVAGSVVPSRSTTRWSPPPTGPVT